MDKEWRTGGCKEGVRKGHHEELWRLERSRERGGIGRWMGLKMSKKGSEFSTR
jgi:hypothetical protein